MRILAIFSGEAFIFLKLQLNLCIILRFGGIGSVCLCCLHCAEFYGDFFSQFVIFSAENAFDLRFFIFLALAIIYGTAASAMEARKQFS